MATGDLQIFRDYEVIHATELYDDVPFSYRHIVTLFGIEVTYGHLQDWLVGTDQGRWIMDHVKKPKHNKIVTPQFEHAVTLCGYVSDEDWTWYLLLFGTGKDVFI